MNSRMRGVVSCFYARVSKLYSSSVLFLKLRDVIPSNLNILSELEPQANLSFGTLSNYMRVQTTSLRYPGGMGFSRTQHHFIKFLIHGTGAIREYYQIHQPLCPLGMHFLSCDGFKHPTAASASLTLQVPWAYATEAEGEDGLSPDHGQQAFGPVSDRKLRLEMRRLKSAFMSISRFGLFFSDGTFRLPQGYYLEDDKAPNSTKVFLVVSGKHRVAVLSHLGWKAIPVAFSQAFPRVVKISQLTEWPGVADKRFTPFEAEAIFRAYFRPIDTPLRPAKCQK